MNKNQNKNLFCKIQSRFVFPPISRLLRHAGGHVGPILLPRTHRGAHTPSKTQIRLQATFVL